MREKLTRSLAGIADYEDFVTADIPKSSAAILLAEVICLKSVATHDREFMDAVGNHLLDWPDKHPSEKFGWGLPFAWDAFGDGTENNPNTVYSISTGLVIKALLDWAEVSSAEVQNRVYEVVDKSLQEWVQSDSFTLLGQPCLLSKPIRQPTRCVQRLGDACRTNAEILVTERNKSSEIRRSSRSSNAVAT